MVETASTMLELGTKAPEFSLPNLDGQQVTPKDFIDAPALLVMFICNHCPFVQHIKGELAALHSTYVDRGVMMIGINANDVANYPDDSPEHMRQMVDDNGWGFPYLYDESQETAKAYRAACTPDFFLFDRAQRLLYRGQLDDSRPGNGLPVTGKDLRAALDAVLAEEPVSSEQRASVGCNIKWKAGNEPDYF